MMQERRQDVGLKMIYGIAGGIIMLLLSIFFNHTYNMAKDAYAIGNNNTKDVAVLGQCVSEVNRRLGSMDVKLDKILNR